MEPLFDEDTDGSRGQTTDEGREPEDVEGDGPRFRLGICLQTAWEDDGMGGIDEGRIVGEAIELLGDLLENGDGGVDGGRRLEEEI